MGERESVGVGCVESGGVSFEGAFERMRLSKVLIASYAFVMGIATSWFFQFFIK